MLSTAEVGAVRVVGTESKGKDNKRIRLEVPERHRMNGREPRCLTI